jgi:hypothetical protein
MVHSRSQGAANRSQQDAEKMARKLRKQRKGRPSHNGALREDARQTQRMDTNHRTDQSLTLEGVPRQSQLQKSVESSQVHAIQRQLRQYPPLVVRQSEFTENKDKARVLMESFFPRPAEPTLETTTEQKEEIPWEPITEAEIERALKEAKGKTAPREDGLPTLVWKNTWKHILKIVLEIFTASVKFGYYPKRWKTAMIVVLRKLGKPDYAVPGAYSPISLLNPLEKLLEAVMARRLM